MSGSPSPIRPRAIGCPAPGCKRGVSRVVGDKARLISSFQASHNANLHLILGGRHWNAVASRKLSASPGLPEQKVILEAIPKRANNTSSFVFKGAERDSKLRV